MSNRRRLRPSVCRAIGRDGNLLVKQATYKDPGVFVPPGLPLNLAPVPRERKFRPGGPARPMPTGARLANYARQRHGPITAAQSRRVVKKLRHNEAKEGTRS